MCLTRNVFSSGNFQTDNEAKATALIESFDEVFSIQLPRGANKRGAYIRIPVQVVQALTIFFTGSSKATVLEIVESLEGFPQEDILTFINTWFAFYRIYRNPKHPEQLFIFRKSDITEKIAQLQSWLDSILWGAQNVIFQEHLRKMAEKIEVLSGVAIADMDGIIVLLSNKNKFFHVFMYVNNIRIHFFIIVVLLFQQ